MTREIGQRQVPSIRVRATSALPREGGRPESPTKHLYDNEGKSASAIVSQPEHGPLHPREAGSTPPWLVRSGSSSRRARTSSTGARRCLESLCNRDGDDDGDGDGDGDGGRIGPR